MEENGVRVCSRNDGGSLSAWLGFVVVAVVGKCDSTGS